MELFQNDLMSSNKKQGYAQGDEYCLCSSEFWATSTEGNYGLSTDIAQSMQKQTTSELVSSWSA